MGCHAPSAGADRPASRGAGPAAARDPPGVRGPPRLAGAARRCPRPPGVRLAGVAHPPSRTHPLTLARLFPSPTYTLTLTPSPLVSLRSLHQSTRPASVISSIPARRRIMFSRAWLGSPVGLAGDHREHAAHRAARTLGGRR